MSEKVNNHQKFLHWHYS